MTLQIDDVIEMLKKAGLVQGNDGKHTNAPMRVEDVIAAIERYYSPELRLETTL